MTKKVMPPGTLRPPVISSAYLNSINNDSANNEPILIINYCGAIQSVIDSVLVTIHHSYTLRSQVRKHTR